MWSFFLPDRTPRSISSTTTIMSLSSIRRTWTVSWQDDGITAGHRPVVPRIYFPDYFIGRAMPTALPHAEGGRYRTYDPARGAPSTVALNWVVRPYQNFAVT